jgi:PKD repeat protein
MARFEEFRYFIPFLCSLCLITMVIVPALAGDPSGGGAWIRVTCSTPFEPRSSFSLAAFHDMLWVIGGATGPATVKNDVWASADGVTWTEKTASAAFSPRIGHGSVVFDHKLWVIGGVEGGVERWLNDVWYSSDGVNWTRATDSAAFSPRHFHAVAVFDNRMWVMGGFSEHQILNDVWYSSDGIHWTLATGSAGFAPRSGFDVMVHDGKMWVLGGNTMSGPASDIWYSSDGITWTQAMSSAPFTTFTDHAALEFNGTMWVIPNQFSLESKRLGLWHSADGVRWVEGDLPPSSSSERPPSYTINYGLYYEIRAIQFGDKVWVIREYVDSADRVKNDLWYASPDTLLEKPPVARFSTSKTFGPAPLTVDFTDTSINGPTSWIWDFGDGTRATEQNPSHTYGSAGNFTVTLSIENGFGKDSGIRTIMVDPPGAGIRWVRATEGAEFGSRFSYPSVVHDQKMWVIGGGYFDEDYNDVWYSSDGTRWTEALASAPFSPRGGHTLLSYHGKLWVIGGLSRHHDGIFNEVGDHLNDVWCSADGLTWTRVTDSAAFPPRSGHASVVFKDRMWVMGGRGNSSIPSFGNMLNDVWYSTDGATWTRVDGPRIFGPTDDLTAVVFHDEMWVVDGRSTNIWHSGDGINWTLATPSPSEHYGGGPSTPPVVIVFDDKIWLVQDFNGGNPGQSEVLYSHDGAQWTEVSPRIAVDVKYEEWASNALVLGNRIWVMRSYTDRSHLRYAYRNDVWYSALDSSTYPEITSYQGGMWSGPTDIPTLITDILKELLGLS